MCSCSLEAGVRQFSFSPSLTPPVPSIARTIVLSPPALRHTSIPTRRARRPNFTAAVCGGGRLTKTNPCVVALLVLQGTLYSYSNH